MRATALGAILLAGLLRSPSVPALKSGDRAPGFTLTGADGRPYSLAQYRDRVVVLEWFNADCPFVRKFYDAQVMQGWQREATAGPSPVVWLTIASSAQGNQGFLTPKEAQAVREKTGMRNTTLLLDPRGVVGRRYGAKTTPHVFIIRQGRVAYQGAVDDRPSAQPSSLDGAESYFADALAAIRAMRAPRTNATAPYGCPVKY